jgi:hypothetical protein
MLIATFGPSTVWKGTQITLIDGRLQLENHGPITPGDVMEYDRQGYLVWADEGTRAWVGSHAATGPGEASGDAAAPSLLKRAVVWVIIALLVLNLVLLLIVSHVVHLW